MGILLRNIIFLSLFICLSINPVRADDAEWKLIHEDSTAKVFINEPSFKSNFEEVENHKTTSTYYADTWIYIETKEYNAKQRIKFKMDMENVQVHSKTLYTLVEHKISKKNKIWEDKKEENLNWEFLDPKSFLGLVFYKIIRYDIERHEKGIYNEKPTPDTENLNTPKNEGSFFLNDVLDYSVGAFGTSSPIVPSVETKTHAQEKSGLKQSSSNRSNTMLVLKGVAIAFGLFFVVMMVYVGNAIIKQHSVTWKKIGEENYMKLELVLLLLILGGIALTDVTNLATLLGSMLSPLLWFVIYVGYKMAQHLHKGQNRLYQYMYVAVLSFVFKYIDITILAPALSGSNPERMVGYRLFFSVYASLVLILCYNIIKILKERHKTE